MLPAAKPATASARTSSRPLSSLLAAMRDTSVRGIALRAVGLSPKSLNAIKEMIERVRELEGLPSTTEPDDAPTGGRSPR